MKRLLAVILWLSIGASAQTLSTITGIVQSLDGYTVTAGKITFTLKPTVDTTIANSARFASFVVTCKITANGQIKAANGTDPCTIKKNTTLSPAGTYFQIDICPYNACTSRLNAVLMLDNYDFSTIAPTPASLPVYNVTQAIVGAYEFSIQSQNGALGFSDQTFIYPQWQALHAYALNAIFRPTDSTGISGSAYRVTVAGTSSSSESSSVNYPRITGVTGTNGSISYQLIGRTTPSKGDLYREGLYLYYNDFDMGLTQGLKHRVPVRDELTGYFDITSPEVTNGLRPKIFCGLVTLVAGTKQVTLPSIGTYLTSPYWDGFTSTTSYQVFVTMPHPGGAPTRIFDVAYDNTNQFTIFSSVSAADVVRVCAIGY